MGIRMKELSLKRGEASIYGRMYLPQEEKETYPVMILAHGFGGSHEEMVPYAQMYAEEGIASYVFDFCGGGYESRSDGRVVDMSVLTEAADLSAVIDQIKELDYIDEKNLFLMGNSQGGFISAYVASERKEDVRALALLYPAFVLQDDARMRMKEFSVVPQEYTVMGVTIGRIYADDALSFDIYDMLPKYDREVLIQHGDQDVIVPLKYSQRAVETYPSAELVVVKGAGHGFDGQVRKDAAERILRLVRKNLRG